MKRQILLFVAMIHLALIAQTQQILPDSVWEDSKTADWYVNGTTFSDYNGTVYCASLKIVNVTDLYAVLQQSLYPYFYIFNKDHKNESLSQFKFGSPQQNYINYFGYPEETETGGMDPQITGRNFFFQYNGQFWYFHHILTGLTTNGGKDRKNESYECFAQMNLNSQGKLTKVYYDLHDPVPDVIKYGAFQLDSLLFFIGINQNTASQNYHKWYIQKYTYNSSSDKFVKSTDPDILIPNIKSSTAFGGFFTRLDSLQNLQIMLDTYNPSTSGNYIGLITQTKTTSGYTFSYKTLDSVTYNSYPVGAIVLVEGALRGQRSSEPNPTLTDRLNYVLICSSKASDGKYHMYYKEFYIHPDNTLQTMYQGEVKLGNYPSIQTYYVNGDKKTAFDMTSGFELIPKDYSNQLSGIDGYQERMNIYYPDGSADMNAAEFYSDQFKLNDLSTVVSTDLDDTLSYIGIQGLWSLNGIVDGAPPCSMNWPAWDSTLNLNQHEDAPTEMEFIANQDSSVTTVGTYDDQWSVGANIDFQKQLGGKSKKALTVSGDLKYFGAYESEIQNKTTWRKDAITSFSLHEYNQEQGWFIWTVPELTRYKYDVYPWWETSYNHPVPNTTNYLFRTTGMATALEPVNLDEDPFYITNPNDPDLQSWKQGESRDSMVNYSLQYSRPPIGNVTWTSGQNGTALSYAVISGTSSKYTFTNGFEEKISVGIKIPKVFEFSVYESNEFSYATTVECETQFGNEIAVSLKNLTHTSMGINISHLNMDVYWMHMDSVKISNEWEAINWWYYDSLGGMKPWYIAYKVNTAYAAIRLTSPVDKTEAGRSGLLFTWIPEGEPLSDFVVYVATSPSFSASSVVYRNTSGGSHSLNPVGFEPVQGQTYSWIVSGKTASGEVVWSPKSSFTVETAEQDPAGQTALKAVVYPNPGHGSEMRITCSAEVEGPGACFIYSAGGTLLHAVEIRLSGNRVPTTIQVPAFIGKGVYVVEIRSPDQRVVRKMVVM